MTYYPSYLPLLPRNKSHGGNVVKTIGEGIVMLEPNQAQVTIGVTSEGSKLKELQEENSRLISALKEAIEAAGIKRKDMKTSDFSIYPQYEFIDQKSVFKGFKIDHYLTIKVLEIAQVGQIIDTALANGANSVRGLSFFANAESEIQAYQQALALALRQAHEKAVTITKQLHAQLIATPIHITEMNQTGHTPIFMHASSLVGGASTQIEPGQLQIKAVIQATYQYFV